MMLPREQRAELVQAVLEKRNLTRNAAHERLEISRPSIEKLWKGRDVELEIVEKFARGLGLEVNEWREIFGYPPVLTLRSGPYVDLERGKEIRAVLDSHGLTIWGAARRAEISYSAMLEMAQGELVREIDVEQFARAFSLDVDDLRESFGYQSALLPVERPGGAPDLGQLGIGQHESPSERLERRHSHAAGILGRVGFTVPPLPLGSHGGKFKTDEEADNAYLSWLENVEIFNDGRKVPDELRVE